MAREAENAPPGGGDWPIDDIPPDVLAFLRALPAEVQASIKQHIGKNKLSPQDAAAFLGELVQETAIEYRTLAPAQARVVAASPQRFGLMPADAASLSDVGLPK